MNRRIPVIDGMTKQELEYSKFLDRLNPDLALDPFCLCGNVFLALAEPPPDPLNRLFKAMMGAK